MEPSGLHKSVQCYTTGRTEGAEDQEMVQSSTTITEYGKDEISQMAHLLRRAGFGATFEELEDSLSRGYEATVERLLHPEAAPEWDDALSAATTWTRTAPCSSRAPSHTGSTG